MAATSHDDVHFVRIGGIVDGSGDVVTFTTAPAPSGWTGPGGLSVVAAPGTLLTPVVTPSNEIDWLGSMTASPKLDVTIRQSDAYPLPYKGGDPVLGADGSSVRVVKFATKDSGTITVTDDTNVSTSTVYWLGVEAVEVTGKSSDVLTVSRGQQGTRERVHALSAGSDIARGIGPILRDGPATLKGLDVTAGVIESDGTEVVRFAGFVDAIDTVGKADGTVVRLTIRSIVQHLLDSRYDPPRARGWNEYAGDDEGANVGTRSSQFGAIRWGPSAGFIEVDADQYGPSTVLTRWTHARYVGASGKWIVVPVTYQDTITTDAGTSIDRYLPQGLDEYGTVYEAPTPVTATGEGTEIHHLYLGELIDHIRDVVGNVERVEFVPVYENGLGEVATLFVAFLGAVIGFPQAASLQLGTDLYSSTLEDTLFNALAYGGAPPQLVNCRDGETFVLPDYTGETWGDLLRDFLRPAFLGLVVNGEGKLDVIDWMPRAGVVTVAPDDIDGDDALDDAAFRILDQQIDVRSGFLLSYGYKTSTSGGAGTFNDTYEGLTIRGAEFGAADIQNIETSKVSGIYSGHPRWRAFALARHEAALARYGAAIPIAEFSIRETPSLDIGSRVRITRSDWPLADGTIGTLTVNGFVISRSVDGARVQALRVALTDYYEAEPAAATWAPAGDVTAYSAPDVTIAANTFTDASDGEATDDIDAWDLVDYAGGETVAVKIVDENFLEVGTATVVGISTGARTLELSSPSITPTSSHFLLLDDYDDQSDVIGVAFQAGIGGPPAWLCDAAGTLGAASDDPSEWEG